MGGVLDELAVDGVGDLALEGAHGLLLGVVLLEAVVEVGTTQPAASSLGDGDPVQSSVELTIAARVEAVVILVP